jgi:hypothetical protein
MFRQSGNRLCDENAVAGRFQAAAAVDLKARAAQPKLAQVAAWVRPLDHVAMEAEIAQGVVIEPGALAPVSPFGAAAKPEVAPTAGDKPAHRGGWNFKAAVGGCR